MSDDGDKDQGKEAKRQSRPVSAAARRERRASARPAGKGAQAKSETDPAKARTAATGKAEASGKAKAGQTSGAPDKPSSAGKTRPTPKRARKEKQASLIDRLVRFMREVWAELRKVIWPGRQQMITYTTVVLAFVVFMVALVAGLDVLFLKGIEFVFGA